MTKVVYPTVENAFVLAGGFGYINHSLYPFTNGRHMGIDIVAALGSNIYAVTDGTVIETGYQEKGGYGRRVVLQHDGFLTLYGHLQSVSDAASKVGNTVVAGQVIGAMGGNVEDKFRGVSGGTHLHFEVILPNFVIGSIQTYKGYTVDPLPFLAANLIGQPAYAGQVTARDGLRIRSQPLVSGTVSVYGALSLNTSIFISETRKDESTNSLWARIHTVREEWVAAVYRGVEYVRLTKLGTGNQPDPVVPPAQPAPANPGVPAQPSAIDELVALRDKIDERIAALRQQQ